MAATNQNKKAQPKKQPVKKRVTKKEPEDPNAINDIYTEKDLDPAYDETIGDDIAYDYDGPSGDPGDR